MYFACENNSVQAETRRGSEPCTGGGGGWGKVGRSEVGRKIGMAGGREGSSQQAGGREGGAALHEVAV